MCESGWITLTRTGGRVTSQGCTQGSVMITVRDRMWWVREDRGSIVVALVVAALAVLLLGVCDSGGHHRLVGVKVDEQALPVASAAPYEPHAPEILPALTPASSVGCQGGDRDHCSPVAEQHVATQAEDRRFLQELPGTAAGKWAAAAPVWCSGIQEREFPVTAGRDVLNRLCVSRR